MEENKFETHTLPKMTNKVLLLQPSTYLRRPAHILGMHAWPRNTVRHGNDEQQPGRNFHTYHHDAQKSLDDDRPPPGDTVDDYAVGVVSRPTVGGD
jgi:hypothetical protein